METYENFVKKLFEEYVIYYGGLREFSRKSGIDKSIISKCISGKYIPSEKTLNEWFEGLELKTETVVISYYKLPIQLFD